MKRTPLSRGLKAFSAVTMFAGIGLIASSGMLRASLADDAVNLAGDAEEAAQQLALGILLIVLGFMLRGLARMRDERPVHITVVPKKRKRTIFWMEMHI